MAGTMKTSPLAPAGGFPDMPVIDGLRFSAIEAGVKYTGRKDVMLAEICSGASIAGVFTRSATRSAPVLDCQAKLGTVSDADKGFAILVNSGNSNAFTGQGGVASVEVITAEVAKTLRIPQTHVYTSSTGVIGEPLEHGRITDALADLSSALSETAIEDAAEAILTTDTFPKGCCRKLDLGGTTVTIAGIAKGSGMIAPDMATMLVYIFTDAKVAQPVLQQMVSGTNEETFNAITVDSDTSTSDTVLVAATGQVDMPEITETGSDAGQSFAAALRDVMRELAHQVVRDGEGATKFVEIRVNGASDTADAKKVAMAIANSPLVKTAIAGEDANWGRVVMAVGKSGAKADRDRLGIAFGDITVAQNGWRVPDYSEEEAAAYMKNETIVITVDLGVGAAEFTAWTCDLTHGYITINADYRS